MYFLFQKNHNSVPIPASSPTFELYAQIGQLKVEIIFKKKLQETGDINSRALLITPKVNKLSVRKQCDLLCVNRSKLYYRAVAEKPENVKSDSAWRCNAHRSGTSRTHDCHNHRIGQDAERCSLRATKRYLCSV